MSLSPIALFTYNRLWHTQQTIESLQKNHLACLSDLYIYCDGAKENDDFKKVAEVREYVRTITGFKSVKIIERDENCGLANSIIDGVTEIVNKYGNIIVIEDDLVTSPYFLRYMNEALEMYEENDTVASIHAYIYPIDDLPESFFIRGADCWGWATWARAWEHFEPDGKKLLEELKIKNLTREFDYNSSYGFTKMLKNQIKGKNNSWAVRWYASAFLNEMFTLYVGNSLVHNIGNDSSGTHNKSVNIFDVDLNNNYKKLRRIEIQEDKSAKKKMSKFCKSIKYKYIRDLFKKKTKFLKIQSVKQS